MHYSFDLHGVLDKYPEIYGNIIRSLKENGHRVSIITGASTSKAQDFLRSEFPDLYIHFNEIYSIPEYLEVIEKETFVNEKGRVWAKDVQDWNKAKAQIAKIIRTDVHFDDTEEYGKNFPCTFILVK